MVNLVKIIKVLVTQVNQKFLRLVAKIPNQVIDLEQRKVLTDIKKTNLMLFLGNINSRKILKH
jgi:hypothetical protein